MLFSKLVLFLQNTEKNKGCILIKLSANVGNDTENWWFNFCGDPHHHLKPRDF